MCWAFYVFVVVYDVLCMRGDFVHQGDVLGRWLAWLALLPRFDGYVACEI